MNLHNLSKRRRVALIVVASLVGLVVLSWLTISMVFVGYKIPSESMSPTLGPVDRVLARSIDPHDVSSGDVIIYLDPAEELDFPLIARVVAVAGDEIGTDGSFLRLNGELADEPWLPDGQTTLKIEPQTVPEGHVFVMGDNRHNSRDSREFGPVPYANVRKLVVVQWWPISEFGGF